MDTILERNALAGSVLPPVGDDLQITVARDCGRLVLRARPTARDAVGDALGFPLPADIGDLRIHGGVTAACLGPDEWYLLVDPAEEAALVARLSTLREGCSTVDVGHREVGIEVSGRSATLALRSFCTLDLDEMAAGTVTRTLLDKAQAVLIKYAPDHYRIEVWASFADHVWGLLACARNEIRLDI